MASHTLVPLGDRQHLVLERRWLPLLDVVALDAPVPNPFMESVRRSLVAGDALFPSRGVEQLVGELLVDAIFGYPQMIAVAGDAVVLYQLLMEG